MGDSGQGVGRDGRLITVILRHKVVTPDCAPGLESGKAQLTITLDYPEGVAAPHAASRRVTPSNDRAAARDGWWAAPEHDC